MLHERHYTVKELSQLLKFSDKTIRRLVLSEPGVIIIPQHGQRKRVYRPIRVPESVAERVINRLKGGR